jgi:predicted ATP-binding protein involved in virulence
MYLFPLEEDPLAGEAIVIIDEVDLHLHPRWQRRVIQQLGDMFPRTRFLLTTHSPAVVQNAIDENYQVVVLRDTAIGVTPHILTQRQLQGLKHATMGSILVDDALFDVPSRFSPAVEEIEKTVRRLRQLEEAGEATEQERQELLRMLEQLRLYQAVEEERRGEAPFMSEIARVRIAFLRDLSRQGRKK